MQSFSVASLTSTCETISHRLVSTAVELDQLARPLAETQFAQRLAKLTSRVQQSRQITDQLRERLSSSSVISLRLQGVLDHILTTCNHGTAIFDKEIRRGEDLLSRSQQGPGLRIFWHFHNFLVAYSNSFQGILHLLTIPTANEQDAKLDKPAAIEMLEKAEAAYVTLTRSAGQEVVAGSSTDTSSAQPPPAYTPTASTSSPLHANPAAGGTDNSLTSDAQLDPIQRGMSALTSSFKAFTASLRPKPDPLVNPLCQAVARGDFAQAQGLISHGANINGRDEFGRTPLVTAIQQGYYQGVEWLLSAGADVSTRDSAKRKPPLLHAVETGNMALVKLLLSNGANPNERGPSGVIYFVDGVIIALNDKTGKVNALEIARLFLTHGVDVNARDSAGRPLLIHAIQAIVPLPNQPAPQEQPSLALITLLLDSGADANARDSNGRPAVVMALLQDNIDLMQMLLSRGADANSRDTTGNSLLVMAVNKGRPDLVQKLLDKGADASARDARGRAAVLIAYAEMQTERAASAAASPSQPAPDTGANFAAIIRALLKHGADLNVTDWPTGTPLVAMAMRDNNTDVVRLLVEGGVNVNTTVSGRYARKDYNNRGETLLLAAIDSLPTELVRLLIERGANVGTADHQGRTPLVMAMLRQRWDVVRLLVARGADVNKLGALPPVVLAKAMGQQGVVDLLVAKGATGMDEAVDFNEGASDWQQPQQQGSVARTERTQSPPPKYGA